ncbi:MAG: nitroreductase family protein [Candidatus Aminicenantales bacterium]
MTEPTPLDKLIRSRRSIRRYLPDPVDREKIRLCLEAARMAPSAENSQPWRFLIVDDPALKERLAAEAFTGIYSMTNFAAQAPALVVVLASPRLLTLAAGRGIQGVPFHFIDLGIAGEHFILKAEEMGLATCWIGWFNVRRTRRLLKIPRRFRIAALLALGYAASRPPSETKRKPLAEIAWFNKVGG